MSDKLKKALRLSGIIACGMLFTLAGFADGHEGSVAISKGLAAIAVGLGAIGAGVGMGILGGHLLDSIARQPEQEGNLMGKFFIVAGLTDAVAIIAVVLGMIVVFA